MAAGERFTITSMSGVTSVMVAENDSLPPRIPLGGLVLGFNANSTWMATVGVDNGVGIIDITSMLCGSSSFGGTAGAKLFRLPTFTPWKVWVNCASNASFVNVSAGLG